MTQKHPESLRFLCGLRRVFALFLAGFCMVGCGMSNAPSPAAANRPATGAIAPEDFALVPCGPGQADRACPLAVAGGKRLLFGTPAGVAASLEPADLRQLDGVFLFSLRARDIEGLDEVRNASWQAGRSAPLLVVGPDGTERLVGALNLAFEQADALRIVVEGIPPGGYDSAILVSREMDHAARSSRLFDTGDLQVTGRESSTGLAEYRVRYRGDLILSACGATPGETVEAVSNASERRLDCGSGDLSWPLAEIHFIVGNQGP